MAQGLGLKLHCLEDDLLDAYPLKRASHYTNVPCSLEAWIRLNVVSLLEHVFV
jgi:hypothetical protein